MRSDVYEDLSTDYRGEMQSFFLDNLILNGFRFRSLIHISDKREPMKTCSIHQTIYRRGRTSHQTQIRLQLFYISLLDQVKSRQEAVSLEGMAFFSTLVRRARTFRPPVYKMHLAGLNASTPSLSFSLPSPSSTPASPLAPSSALPSVSDFFNSLRRGTLRLLSISGDLIRL